MAIELTFLGTGTSQGVPIIGCNCDVCISTNPKDKRLRAAVHIKSETTSIVIDTGPDFRQQMLRENINKLDAILITHTHKDHLAGLDDIRAYNYLQKKSMDVYASKQSWDRIKLEFDYVFASNKYPGVPNINEFVINENTTFQIGDLHIKPILVWHHKMPVMGFSINELTYITDANYIDPKELAKIVDTKVLVLNALQKTPHISHFTLSEAITIAQEVGASQTFFTHISHRLGLHDQINAELPMGISLAYDGLKIWV